VEDELLLNEWLNIPSGPDKELLAFSSMSETVKAGDQHMLSPGRHAFTFVTIPGNPRRDLQVPDSRYKRCHGPLAITSTLRFITPFPQLLLSQ
jgi:hypothetical protein